MTTSQNVEGEMKRTIESYLRMQCDLIHKIDKSKLVKLVKFLSETRDKNKTVFILGNGGSAATALHFSCDLSKNTIKDHEDPEIKRLRAISIMDNVSIISAYANDISFDKCLSEQLKTHLNVGDTALFISGSGNSKNLIEAVQYARQKKARTFGILGVDGGKIASLLDDYLLVPSTDYGLIETTHLLILHIVTKILKQSRELIKP